MRRTDRWSFGASFPPASTPDRGHWLLAWCGERARVTANCSMQQWPESTPDFMCARPVQAKQVADNPYPHFSSMFQIRLVYSGRIARRLAALILENMAMLCDGGIALAGLLGEVGGMICIAIVPQYI